MSKELTDRQKQILNFIRGYIETNGYPPTYREIGFNFSIASTFGVKRHLDALHKKGFIRMEENSSRTLSLTSLSSPDNERINDDAIELPIVGRVAAGYPILAEQNIEGSITISASMLKNKTGSFGLKVKGDSMIEAGIFEGDVVIVTPQKSANNGDIIIAMLQDEATLKRYEKKENTVYLIPENKNYNIIEVNNREDFSIIGKVLGVFRWYN
ncbi:MAG: transcriptional repressor LexA [Melioribacteraceae bacterium]|nr:transcriptional repressor LexA [Melioribacteraceae bacterium]